ncbi:MAG: hypothetical protein V1887_03805 [Candidatus Aenigmatarchaeota archaeon]
MADFATVGGVLTRLGLPDMLLWLLTFSVVYGILNQANVPKGKSVQAILALVVAFLVIMSAPTALLSFITSLSSNLVLVLVGILVLVVLFEAFGIKHFLATTEGGESHSYFSKYPAMFAVGFVVLAGLVFVGSGGLDVLGITLPSNVNINSSGTIFLIGIVLAVIWLIIETGDKKGK